MWHEYLTCSVYVKHLWGSRKLFLTIWAKPLVMRVVMNVALGILPEMRKQLQFYMTSVMMETILTSFVSAQTTGSDWESIRAHCGLSTSRTINALAAAARPTFTSYSRLTAESVCSRIKRQREKASVLVWWFHAEAISSETVTAAPFSSLTPLRSPCFCSLLKRSLTCSCFKCWPVRKRREKKGEKCHLARPALYGISLHSLCLTGASVWRVSFSLPRNSLSQTTLFYCIHYSIHWTTSWVPQWSTV